ncbi:RNA polymerase III-inhibiting protein maf1 [Penicillium lagena]|uniref:RNA polymerase III-inhibiting protein maf1 n=1 Tax=Penicillium lagena TaxID=94218 RepID=UPI00254238C6|nr:RNA polymerase III-inhibiting protein maf1 [Penicillium lagena]KAJ5623983.1 RNA polymerase III-inhibiting protein maf1 [Penicillium lagena]
MISLAVRHVTLRPPLLSLIYSRRSAVAHRGVFLILPYSLPSNTSSVWCNPHTTPIPFSPPSCLRLSPIGGCVSVSGFPHSVVSGESLSTGPVPPAHRNPSITSVIRLNESWSLFEDEGSSFPIPSMPWLAPVAPFLPLPEFEDITSSLNFQTADCHIVGGCDLYTTKAARSDRKLYKNIEQSLEAQYESVLRLSASLSPPNASDAAVTLNLSRSSPFGPLSEHSSRRTFAYLIATLNASHPDYDFSHVLRPSDFRRERHLKRVMNTVDSTLSNLRPRETIDLSPSSPPATLSGSYNAAASPAWGPRMWRIMDDQMSLGECSVYSYSPEEDPSVADDGAIWSLHYFFFNPMRKRVCYMYLRAIPILSHTPPDEAATTPTGKRTFDDGYLTPDLGSSKRARYWLGDRVDSTFQASDSEGDDEEDIAHSSNAMRPVVDDYDHYMLSDEEVRSRSGSKGTVRAMSEEIADSMEV